MRRKAVRKKGIINVGIIGAGGIAEGAHIPGYLATEGVKIMAVCDINEERAKYVANKFNIPLIFTDYKDLVAVEEIDAVSVCTPNNFHAGPTIAALESGKHVLCEKPIAGNAKDGQAMVDAAKRTGKILQIGLHMRFERESQVLKRFIEEGELGDIYFTRAVAMRRRGIPSWGAFVEKKMSGGGPLVDIGVHILDLVVWLMGCPKPVSATGMTYTKFGNRKDICPGPWGWWKVDKFDVEDFAVAFVKFDNGATAVLETSWAANIEGVGPTYLLGDKGGAQIHPLKIYQDKHGTLIDVTPVLDGGRMSPHTAEVQAFIRAIREGLPSPVPGEEALEITKIFDAVYEATRTGRMVRIK